MTKKNNNFLDTDRYEEPEKSLYIAIIKQAFCDMAEHKDKSAIKFLTNNEKGSLLSRYCNFLDLESEYLVRIAHRVLDGTYKLEFSDDD